MNYQNIKHEFENFRETFASSTPQCDSYVEEREAKQLVNKKHKHQLVL